MKKYASENSSRNNAKIDTQPHRSLLSQLTDAALQIDIDASPDKAIKLVAVIITLTKSIRETEVYNRGCAAAHPDIDENMSLEERLKGFAPSPEELKKLRADLRKRLQVLGPRLLREEQDD